jgi:hypothetical protein
MAEKIDPASALGRHLDIMKQGFMKPLPKPRAQKVLPPIVACCGCLNWQPERTTHNQRCGIA